MKRILIVFCFGYLASLHAMDHLHLITEAAKNSPLFDAIREKNFEKVQALLDQGEDVNARYAVSDETPLMEAGSNGAANICKLLLERGADVCLEEFNGETALKQVMCGGYMWHEEGDDEDEIYDDFKRMSDVIKTLIVDSMFVPYCLQNKMNDGQHRIMAILCSLQSVCPRMPRDIRYKILGSDEEIMKCALLSPFGSHRGHYERALSMPYSVAKLLVKGHVFDGEATVQRLKIHKMEILRLLVQKSWVDFFGCEDDDEEDDLEDKGFRDRIRETVFWPTRDNWESHYTPMIEDAIREKLGLMHK